MGKYTNVAAHLRPKPEEPKFQEKVNAVRKQVGKLSETDIARKLIQARKTKEDIKEQLKAANVRVVAFEQMLMDSDAFSEGVTTLGLDTGETLSTQVKPWARVHDHAAFRAWCIDNGLAEALTLPWQSMNALVSERLVEGLPEPPGIDTYFQTTVVLRKGRS
jgi:hypothetical protein